MEPTDELFPVVKMGPRRSYDVEISTPGRIAALEAEVERLRRALNDVAWVADAGDPRHMICPWCDCDYPEHNLNCIRQAALEPQP